MEEPRLMYEGMDLEFMNRLPRLRALAFEPDAQYCSAMADCAVYELQERRRKEQGETDEQTDV